VQYQVRFDVNDPATAESIRRKVRQPALAPLFDILAMHRAAPKCQFDAFAEYVAAAEEQGVKGDPFRRSIAQPLDVNAAKLSPVCSARKRRPRQSGAPYASERCGESSLWPPALRSR
jgi:hypothetical protein